jgi:hypothetical protein
LAKNKDGFEDPFKGEKWHIACPTEAKCKVQDPCTSAAWKAMRDSGFCLWSGEAWHFEVQPGVSSGCS